MLMRRSRSARLGILILLGCTAHPRLVHGDAFAVSRVCVVPAPSPFNPLAPMSLSPVPRPPRAWWRDAALMVYAAGCHSSSELLLGVPRVSPDGPGSWKVDGCLTTRMPSGRPVLPDCGAGHFAYHLGRLDPGHHEVHAASSTLSFDVPPEGAFLPPEATVGDGSCIDVVGSSPTGPSVTPDGNALVPSSPGSASTGSSSAPLPPGALVSASYPSTPDEITDRDHFIDRQAWPALPGEVVGILGSTMTLVERDGQRAPFVGATGDTELTFTTNGLSHRTVYVEVARDGRIRNLAVPTARPDVTQTYPFLELASGQTLNGPLRAGIAGPFALAELEINHGSGAVGNRSYGFVATKARVLDGTPEYPIRTSEVVAELMDRYDLWAHTQEAQVAALLARKEAARPPTFALGPRHSWTTLYVTWMTDTHRLRVHLATRWSESATDLTARPPSDLGRRPFNPPTVRFGVELGQAYEVGLDRRLAWTGVLPLGDWDEMRHPVRTDEE